MRQHAAESRLISLENIRFYRHVFRDASLGMIVTTDDGTITRANPAAELLLGWKPGKLVGRPIAELLAPGQPEIPFRAPSARRGTWVSEVQHRRRSGAIVRARLTISAIRDDTDELLGYVAVLADDTANLRAQARLASLVRLGALLQAETTPAVMLKMICEEARALFAVDGVYLYRFDEPRQELVGHIAVGPTARPFPELRISLSVSNLSIAQAVRERRPVILHNIVPESHVFRSFVEQHRIRATLAVPLFRGERVLGSLILADTGRGDRFSEEDTELAQSFGEVVVVALENARLHEAERGTSEKLLTLVHVGQLLTASLEAQDVFEAIVDGALRLLSVDDVRIWILEHQDGPARLAHSLSVVPDLPVPKLDTRRTRLGGILRSRRAWQSQDIQVDELWVEREYIRRRGLHSCLVIPMVAADRPLGMITMLTREQRVFDGEEVELAQAFADQAAIAVRNSQILQRERRASRLEHLLNGSGRVRPADRQHIDALLTAAERILDARPGAAGRQTPADEINRPPRELPTPGHR